MPTYPAPECIGGGEATGGTETSKYPEERKSTETPRVAASESGSSPNRRERSSLGALPRRGCGSPQGGTPVPPRGCKGAWKPNGLEGPAEEGD